MKREMTEPQAKSTRDTAWWRLNWGYVSIRGKMFGPWK